MKRATPRFHPVVFGALLMTATAATAVALSPREPLGDAEVLGIYIQVNGFDIETALLGRAQARSSAVRSLATEVASDHMNVRQSAFAIAASCGVIPVLPAGRTPAAADHSEQMLKLARLGGAEFDQAFLRQDVAFHRAAVEAVRRVLLPATRCKALKAHLTDILPAFEHHLAATEAIHP